MNQDRFLVQNRVIPAQAGIQTIKLRAREAAQFSNIVRFAECFSYWIPACAGMTALMDELG